VFAEKGEPGYPLQVLALPSSGCGLSTSIPHANVNRENLFSKVDLHIFVIPRNEGSPQAALQRLAILMVEFLAKIPRSSE